MQKISLFKKMRMHGLRTLVCIILRRVAIWFRTRYLRWRCAQRYTWQLISHELGITQDSVTWWLTRPQLPIDFSIVAVKNRDSLRSFTFVQDADFNIFFKDIKIKVHVGDELGNDIKDLWEPMRFQNIYQHSSKEIIQEISLWIDAYPWMYGVAWQCPMEVAIRAINWIFGLHRLIQESRIGAYQAQLEKITCSLYEHLVYLEHTWEIYDGRTNNHYLSDLVGYFYLCWFFKIKKSIWCFQKIMQEFDTQVFDEGSSYEGSTAYHRLVTELFEHSFFIAQQLNYVISKAQFAKLDRMRAFVIWCEGITIGDDDSGYIVHSDLRAQLFSPCVKQKGEAYFPEFGLSVAKLQRLRMSLRHHAFDPRQPSGHFHNDVGSITVTVDGTPVIVDPGSYVYTSSVAWRNYFRSAEVHNSMMLVGHEPVSFDERLFALSLPKGDVKSPWAVQHDLYARFGLRMHRIVSIIDDKIMLIDWWSGFAIGSYTSSWNFTLHPECLVKINGTIVTIIRDDKVILQLISLDLQFTVHEGWCATKYGTKVACIRLQASCQLMAGKKYKIYLE